jgi:membrane-bound serine protease (ClpP class)
LVDSGKTLTFTAIEAEQYGYCDGIAKDIDEVISEYLKVTDYEIISFRPSVMDNIKGFLMSSIFQGILIMLIIGGIYFELQTPGIGFPSIVAVTAALLYFAPLYIEGLAANWEILVFVIGLILLVVEIFAFPGFGITGILGIIFIVAGLTLSLLNNVNFDFKPVKTGELGKALFTVIGGISLGFALVLFLSNRIGKKGILHNIALNTNLENEQGYIGVPMESKSLVGQQAVAGTDLRPSGKIIVDGMSYDAVSEGGVFIAKDSIVQIVKYELGQVYVSKI